MVRIVWLFYGGKLPGKIFVYVRTFGEYKTEIYVGKSFSLLDTELLRNGIYLFSYTNIFKVLYTSTRVTQQRNCTVVCTPPGCMKTISKTFPFFLKSRRSQHLEDFCIVDFHSTSGCRSRWRFSSSTNGHLLQENLFGDTAGICPFQLMMIMMLVLLV